MASSGGRSTKDKFAVMKEWLRKNGGKFEKIYLTYGTDGLRGAHAQKKLEPDTEIIYIPLNCIMTSLVAKGSDIGKKLLASGVELRSAHSFLACFLVVEKHNPNSFWTPYIDVLPEEYSTVPIYYNEEEIGLLKGSFTIQKIADRKASLQMEYDNICRYVEDFAQYSLEDFIWARLSVITRIFGIVTNNVKTDGLVPMADFLTHKRPRETKWTFSDQKEGFVVQTLGSMQPGHRLTTSFGVKCNSRYFVNYGFIVEDNEEFNTAIFEIERPDDPAELKKLKENIIGASEGRSAVFQISINTNDKKEKDFFSYVRVLCATQEEVQQIQVQIDQPWPTNKIVTPVSIENEMKVLDMISVSAQNTLDKFDTTLEEDNRILTSDDFIRESKEWMCVIMRKSEKQTLHFYIELAEECKKLLNKKWGDVQEQLAAIYQQGNAKNRYISSVVIRLLRQRHFQELGN